MLSPSCIAAKAVLKTHGQINQVSQNLSEKKNLQEPTSINPIEPVCLCVYDYPETKTHPNYISKTILDTV